MLIIDTNYLSELERNSAAGKRLRARINASSHRFAVTIVTVEETTRGWLAELKRCRGPHEEVVANRKLHDVVTLDRRWIVLDFKNDAADLFLQNRNRGIRIGTMDLKIACIAVAYDFTLLTRNTRDFSQVPGLHFENWLD